MERFSSHGAGFRKGVPEGALEKPYRVDSLHGPLMVKRRRAGTSSALAPAIEPGNERAGVLPMATEWVGTCERSRAREQLRLSPESFVCDGGLGVGP